MFCSLEFVSFLSDNPMGTGEVAKKIGCSYGTAWRRLHKLHDEGKIAGRKIRPCQAGEWVWWKKT